MSQNSPQSNSQQNAGNAPVGQPTPETDIPDGTPTVAPGPNQVAPHDQHEAPLRQFVSEIKDAEQQVGEHVLAALRDPTTVAVLTTVAIGPDGKKRILSAALDPKRMQQVQQLLTESEKEREPQEPCVGFHCLVQPKP